MRAISSGDVSTRDSVRQGAHVTGSDGPNRTTTGIPNAAATCAGPLSLPMNKDAPDIRLFTSANGALRITRNWPNGEASSAGPARNMGSRPRLADAARLPKSVPRARFFRRSGEGMNHDVGPHIVRRGGGDELCARDLRLRHSQPKHRRRQMLRRMHRPFDTQNLLCAGNLVRVKKTIAMMPEACPDPRAARPSSSCCVCRREGLRRARRASG